MTERLTRADIPGLAELFMKLGAMLGQQVTRNGTKMPAGEAAWLNSLDFVHGPRAAVTDTTGGNRWETDGDGEVWPIPNDATGEAVIGDDPESRLHVRYVTLLGWMQDNGDDLRRLIADLLPPRPNTRVVECTGCGAPKAVDTKNPDSLDEIAAAGFCRSCFRHRKTLREIQTDARTGARYYRDFCRFCGSFKAEHGIEPPIAILRERIEGRRIAPGFIEEHCPHCKAEAKVAQAQGREKPKRGWRREPRKAG